LYLLVFFSLSGFSQAKEIVDKNITLIKSIPEFPCPPPNSNQLKKMQKEFWRKNPEYLKILSLDTLAIPYLIDKISDTTETNIEINCASFKVKIGDVAFKLLNEIILIPMHMVSGMQWDMIGCNPLCDYMFYLHHDRLKFQSELKQFFAGRNGQLWVQLMKHKLSIDEYNKVAKELDFTQVPHKSP